MIATLAAECVLDCRCALGEGPVWNPNTGALDFVDVTGGRLHHFEPRSGRHTVTEVGRHIGSVAPRRGGGWVAAVRDGFGLIDASGGAVEMVAAVLADHDDLRMNDGKCDPQGRFWAGSMSYRYTPEAGTLWRLDSDGSVHTMVERVAVSNGLDWSPDQRTMYYVDSLAFGVDAFDFDPQSGAIANRRRAVDMPSDSTSPLGLTVPDGMTVDAEGALWVAVHGAGEVRRYTPDGELLQVVTLPAFTVTSAHFGGEDLDELYITSLIARRDDPYEPLQGGIFRCRPGVRGRPANLFAG